MNIDDMRTKFGIVPGSVVRISATGKLLLVHDADGLAVYGTVGKNRKRVRIEHGKYTTNY